MGEGDYEPHSSCETPQPIFIIIIIIIIIIIVIIISGTKVWSQH